MQNLVDWEFSAGKLKPGLPPEELKLPSGIVHYRGASPKPKRDRFMARVATYDWDSIVDALVVFWQKLASTLPDYYKGDPNSVDPLEFDIGNRPADGNWNRIVCLIDIVYGKITTTLWKDTAPIELERVYVLMILPMIDDLCRSFSDESFERESKAVNARLREALIATSKREPARSAITSLLKWRKCSLWMMDEESPETLSKIEV